MNPQQFRPMGGYPAAAQQSIQSGLSAGTTHFEPNRFGGEYIAANPGTMGMLRGNPSPSGMMAQSTRPTMFPPRLAQAQALFGRLGQMGNVSRNPGNGYRIPSVPSNGIGVGGN